jgi:hypothetical protein
MAIDGRAQTALYHDDAAPLSTVIPGGAPALNDRDARSHHPSQP